MNSAHVSTESLTGSEVLIALITVESGFLSILIDVGWWGHIQWDTWLQDMLSFWLLVTKWFPYNFMFAFERLLKVWNLDLIILELSPALLHQSNQIVWLAETFPFDFLLTQLCTHFTLL